MNPTSQMVSSFLIDPCNAMRLSDEEASKVNEACGETLQTIHNGIAAIGVMLASIDAEDMGDRHIAPAGMLLDFLGCLAWGLADVEHWTNLETLNKLREALRQERAA